MTWFRIMHTLSRFVIARRHDEAISPPSLQDSSVALTRLTPRWYIKRAMREIASHLAMTAEAGGVTKGTRLFLIVKLKIF